MRSSLSSLLLGVFLSACGSGSGPGGGVPGAAPLANPGNLGGGGVGGGVGGAGGGGGAVQAAVFDDAAIDLGKPGAFPSDLVLSGTGALYTVDDAFVPANVVLLRPDGTTVKTPITAADLVDHDGTRPARAPTSFGTGLFGAFTGDLELAYDRWLLVTVGAGNSVSGDSSGPLRLANLVIIDTETAQVVQTVDLAWTLDAQGATSDGGLVFSIPQSLPVMCAFVPSRNGTRTGKVYVALSNGGGTSAGLTTFFPGTVQEWRADFSRGQPLTAESNGKSVLDRTRTYVSAHYNPVGLTPHRGGNDVDYLILTNAGASRFDDSSVAHATTDTVLEFLDLDLQVWQEGYSIHLGKVLAAPQRIAIGRDGSGTAFGILASQTFAAAYVVDLTGLDSNPVDASGLRALRTVELAPGGSMAPGSDFLPGIGLTASGRTAVLSSFTSAGLRVLALPDDIELGTIAVDPPPFGLAALGSAEAFGLGALVVPGNTVADAYVIVNGSFDPTFAPKRHGFVGTLTVRDRLP